MPQQPARGWCAPSFALVATMLAALAFAGHAPGVARRSAGIARASGGYYTGYDFLAYTDGLVLMRAGLDPYELSRTFATSIALQDRSYVGQSPCRRWPARIPPDQRLAFARAGGRPYLYPPIWAVLLSPIAQLAYPWQGLFSLLLNSLLWGGILLELHHYAYHYRETAEPGAAVRVPWWLIAGAALALSHSLDACFRNGQVNLVLLWLMLVGQRLVRFGQSPRRVVGGGLVWALAVCIKVWPIVPACYLLWLCRPPGGTASATEPSFGRAKLFFRGLLAGFLLWLLVVPGCLLGWRWNLALLGSWVHRILLSEPLLFDGTLVLEAPNQPLRNALRLLYAATHHGVPHLTPLPRPWALAASLVLGLMLLASLLASHTLHRARRPYAAEVGVSLGLVVVLLASPTLWLSACVLLLPFYVVGPLYLLARGRSRWAVGYATLNWLVPFLSGAALSKFGLLGWGTAGMVLLFCGSVLYLDRAPQTTAGDD